jgi:hypothetical protein
MGASCNYCCHYSCVNGESGVMICGNCEKCGEYMVLCSNDLTEEEFDKRCNGEACDCGNTEEWVCSDCRRR